MHNSHAQHSHRRRWQPSGLASRVAIYYVIRTSLTSADEITAVPRAASILAVAKGAHCRRNTRSGQCRSRNLGNET